MPVAKPFDAVICVYYVLERLRAIRNTSYICECNGGTRDGERRYAEIWRVGEGWFATIIHDIKAADTMMVIIVNQKLIEVARLVFDGET